MLVTHMVAKVSITSLAASLPFNTRNGSVGFLEVSGDLLTSFGI